MARLTITQAAERLGVSTDTIRRRIKRGQLQAEKEARPQGSRWMVEIADEDVPPDDATVAGLQAEVSALRTEVESRRREMERLYQLLDQQQQLAMAAQRQLTATIEREQEREQAQPQPQQPPRAPTTARRRRLTWRERVLGTARL